MNSHDQRPKQQALPQAGKPYSSGNGNGQQHGEHTLGNKLGSSDQLDNEFETY